MLSLLESYPLQNLVFKKSVLLLIWHLDQTIKLLSSVCVFSPHFLCVESFCVYLCVCVCGGLSKPFSAVQP